MRFFGQKLVVLFFLLLTACRPTDTKKSEVTIWHWMTDRHETFNALAQKYHQETGIQVNFKLFFPPGLYSQKVIAAGRA